MGGDTLRKKVVVILLCMLVIATALPAVGTINEKEIEENQATLKVQTQLFQEIDYNNLLVNPLNFDDEYRNHPFSSHPPLYPRFNILKGNTDENSIVCGYVIDQETSLPIENAEVDLNWRDNQGNYDWNYTYTTATGFYSMNVAAGEISLYVYASGYLYDETDWNEIAEYETMWVNFSLYPVPPENSVVCGYVQDSDTSLPIEFAGINLNWRDDQGHNLYNYS
jgi:hypothetical protein